MTFRSIFWDSDLRKGMMTHGDVGLHGSWGWGQRHGFREGCGVNPIINLVFSLKPGVCPAGPIDPIAIFQEGSY